MSSISAKTTVYPFFINRGGFNSPCTRIWVESVENKKDRFGKLVLFPKLNDEPEKAKGYTYDLFLIMRRRFREEIHLDLYHDLRAVLSPGDLAEEIDAGVSSQSAPDLAGRTVQFIKGIVVRPGHDVAGKAWFVRVYGEDGKTQINSVRAATAQEAVDKVYEHGWQNQAEQAPKSEPVEEVEDQPEIPRIRPGAFKS